MRIAYLIQVHALERQFHWLFDALYNNSDVFAIHVDAKSSSATRVYIEKLVRGLGNVHFVPSHNIRWGGWSMCGAELESLKRLLALEEDWSFFVNLSGQDYPLKAADEIRSELLSRPCANYVQVLPLSAQRLHIRLRPHWFCIEFGRRMVRLPLPNWRPPRYRVNWYGSQWHILSRGFCEWTQTRPAQARLRWLRHVKIPDEFFMQELLMNSPFRTTNIGNNKREIIWSGAPSPRTLTMADSERLLSSSAFFARKFDERVDSGVLKLLASRVGARLPGNSNRPSKTRRRLHNNTGALEPRPV